MGKKFFALIAISLLINLSFISKDAYGAVSQILNDSFYLNPAELSLVNRGQLLIGNLLVMPELKFNGVTSLGSGETKSKVNDSLPYLLAAYRFSERFVAGVTVTPSSYGHIEWPINSLVKEISTKTKLIYYRIGTQSSYQLSDKLALGVGINLEYNKLAELDFVIPDMGNQINKIRGLNYTGDIGLFYKIDSKTNFTIALYTGVNTFGFGTSSLGDTINNNFSLNITEAAVAFIGLR